MFTHLHTHTEYSLLDGLSQIPQLVERTCELGMDSLAITDHGVMYGAIEFYEEAKRQGIKPIIGLEAYVAPNSRREREQRNRSPYHLTLLALDATGYRNLMQLSTQSHLEGFYYRPRLDRELLERHAEGIAVLSGCPSSELMRALAEGRDDDAREAAGWYADVFGDRYLLEVQEHGQEQFNRLTPGIVDLGKRLDLPLVLTNDSHYTTPAQHQLHDVLLCIGTNSTMQDENRFRLDGDSFYLKSEQEMRALLPELPEAADNTALLAERVDIRLEFGRTQLPDPGVPQGLTAEQYLHQLCEEGLRRRYGSPTDEQRERLRYELDVIGQTGFNEYTLIVHDIARFARERQIPMGVRGSAAASVVLYCLDVIDIEPMQYRLVFERYLNPERISMPDVDFDIADDRRDEVIRYVAERYGRDHVAQIVTFGTLGAKAAIRDTGRALGLAYGDVDRIARLVPDLLHTTIDSALDTVDELRTEYEGGGQVRELIDTARGLEGVSRHASTHAAGVVITREPLADIVPLQRAATDGDDEDALPTTQYDMHGIEQLQLLKLDFLGLTNLTILGRAVELIREHRGETIELTALPDGDPAVAELLAAGHTFGVFQMESAGMRRYVRELQPQNIREIAAMVALYRPGPMEHIPQYIEVKHGRVQPYYPHEDLAGILEETYGVIAYQDQVLEIAKQFAGYSLGQADVMRKAMGKKIPAVMLAERDRFVAGATEQGYDRKLSADLFNLIEPFAGYAFNKAHAFSYGMIAYQTAYLKAHYAVEYMTAVLCSARGSQDRAAAAIAECARLGIEVLPPDVNRSRSNFTVAAGAQPAIHYGLSAIKNVGEAAIEQLIAARDADGPFINLEDFAKRIPPREINKRVLDALARAGAIDSLGDRATIIDGVERLLAVAQQEQRLRETGQTSMFEMLTSNADAALPALELDPGVALQSELLAWEKELLGTYLSDHPFKHIAPKLAEHVTAQTVDLTAEVAGTSAVVAGSIIGVRRLSTRQGKTFAAVNIEDLSGSAELTVWPEQYEQYRERLTSGTIVMAKVSVRVRADRFTAAVDQLAAVDAESGELLEFDPSRFRVTQRGSPRAPHPDRTHGAGEAQGTNRSHLRPVERSEEPVVPSRDSAQNRVDAAAERAGPHRLRIDLEETTDQPADRRRMRSVCALIRERGGQTPVELHVIAGDGSRSRLQLPTVGVTDDLVGQINALIGVLGAVREVGEAASDAAIASDAPALAAGGG